MREVFHGPVTYVSVPLETVEWSRFDFVSVDLYRGAELTDRFTEVQDRYLARPQGTHIGYSSLQKPVGLCSIIASHERVG